MSPFTRTVLNYTSSVGKKYRKSLPLCYYFTSETMPILYSVVARGTTVLAKFASCAGNFAEVTEQILSRIPPENSKLTYTQGR